MTSIKPSFIVIGAHKAGTTSLYEYLGQHPEVYVPTIKETNFFAYGPDHDPNDKYYPVKTWEQYLDLFRAADGYHAVGEVSPEYLLNPQCPRAIKNRLPDCKLIVSLRNPVTRAYSHYADEYRHGQRTGPLPPRSDNVNIHERWVLAGFYLSHLQAFYKEFGAQNILAIKFEELTRDPDRIMREIFGFIGVDQNVGIRTGVQYNMGGVPKNQQVYSLTRRLQLGADAKRYVPGFLRQRLSTWKTLLLNRLSGGLPPLPGETQEKLRSLYAGDMLALADLTRLDLTDWKLD